MNFLSIAKARQLTGTELLVYLNQTNFKPYAASITAATPKKLDISVPGQGGPVSYDLTQDGTTSIPVYKLEG